MLGVRKLNLVGLKQTWTMTTTIIIACLKYFLFYLKWAYVIWQYFLSSFMNFLIYSFCVKLCKTKAQDPGAGKRQNQNWVEWFLKWSLQIYHRSLSSGMWENRIQIPLLLLISSKTSCILTPLYHSFLIYKIWIIVISVP